MQSSNCSSHIPGVYQNEDGEELHICESENGFSGMYNNIGGIMQVKPKEFDFELTGNYYEAGNI